MGRNEKRRFGGIGLLGVTSERPGGSGQFLTCRQGRMRQMPIKITPASRAGSSFRGGWESVIHPLRPWGGENYRSRGRAPRCVSCALARPVRPATGSSRCRGSSARRHVLGRLETQGRCHSTKETPKTPESDVRELSSLSRDLAVHRGTTRAARLEAHLGPARNALRTTGAIGKSGSGDRKQQRQGTGSPKPWRLGRQCLSPGRPPCRR